MRVIDDVRWRRRPGRTVWTFDAAGGGHRDLPFNNPIGRTVFANVIYMRQNLPQSSLLRPLSRCDAQQPGGLSPQFPWLSVFLFAAGWLYAGAASAATDWHCSKAQDGKWICGFQRADGTISDQSGSPQPAQQSMSTGGSSQEAPAEAPATQAAGESTAASSEETTSPSKSGKRGWSCRSGAAKKGWGCTHEGPYVTNKPAATPGRTEPKAKTPGPYAFTGLDESRFRQMLAVVGGNPWAASCAGLPPTSVIPAEYGDRLSSPLEIDSDYSEMEGSEVYTFTGGVNMRRADQRLLGDFVVHDKLTHTLNAHGNVIYREAGTTVAADSMFMKLDTDEGRLRNAQYIFEEVPARGKAETTYFDGKKHSRYEKATFTTCPPNNNDWMLHAARLRVDKNTGEGVASNAWLEFKGVPFFYTPWISFPTDKRRKSGFLAPNFGLSSGQGFSVTLPYYWSMAPNYDLTVYPRYNARRGVILGGDFRYIQPGATGDLQGQYMPNDAIRQQSRGFVSFSDTRTLLPHLNSRINLNYVSDNHYLAEMWNTIYQHGSLNQSNLPSIATVSYADKFGKTNVYSMVRAAHYEVLADNFPEQNKPYTTLPSWTFGGSRPIDVAGGVVSMANEVAHFEHSAAPIVTRANFKPGIAFPWQSTWGFLTPKFSVQHTQYWIDNSVAINPSSINSASRTLPIASVDSGLRFERDTNLFGSAYTHTFEPRLFYLYIPFENQDKLPVVGAANYDFTFASLFRENRFSGIDRIGDANQVSAAITSRLIDQTTGKENLRFSIGKMVDLTTPRVTLVNATTLNPGLSTFANTTLFRPSRRDVIAEATASITDSLKVSPLVLWDYGKSRADRFQLTTHYDAGNNRLFNIGYRYRRGVNDNSDISFSWPISKEWSVVGRWQYQWATNTNLESFVGVQRETCCWKFGIIAREYLTNVAFSPGDTSAFAGTGRNPSSGRTQGVFLSLELKGFANIGDSIGHFLTYSIPGYDMDAGKPQ